ncbi:outer membrane transport energization protein ExbB [Neorhizobium alkalisoli]|uniref:Biopolymer transport protein ExbB n=2 Tax=Neorhizobium alkalisoli TaxID=528178 RepID=A0A561QR77_9HYPH|nr:tonB-system energizer ExbB [Neorhizobium alkalisoli]TWF52837.1 outer membrane transport energization protein ExbB [Neorhizobium alkalisoli]
MSAATKPIAVETRLPVAKPAYFASAVLALALMAAPVMAQAPEQPAAATTSQPTAPAANENQAQSTPAQPTQAPAAQAPAAPVAQTPATPAPASPAPAPEATAPAASQTAPAQPNTVTTPSTQTAPAAPATSATPAETPAPAASSAAPAAPAPAAAPAPVATELAQPGQRSDIPHNLSPWGMFMAADWVVKGVMSGLALASLVTWTIWVAKTMELAGARARANRVMKIVRHSRTLPEALEKTGRRGGPAALMLHAAAHEINLSEAALDYAHNDGVKERVSSVLSRIESYAGRRMARGTGILATIGSVAPFVGLFGTVWGIMNSFIGISQSNTTNLAVVAPGIAEALLATAIGLVAAIPAVVIYNVFARAVTGYRQLLADVAAGVERTVSRDLDFRKAPPGSRKTGPVSLVAGG